MAHRDAVKLHRLNLRIWVEGIKSEKGCQRCGISHPAILDFHHPEPSKKDHMISLMVRKGRGRKAILEEIDKCEVLCKNCHAIEHYIKP